MSDEAKRLLQLAVRDLRVVRGMVADETTFPDEIFGFHAQQAVEKAAKAWLSGHGVIYPKTHDLDLLFELAVEAKSGLPEDFEPLRDLVDFSVQYRYEAFDDLPLERAATLELVTRLVEFVTRGIEGEA